MVLPFFLSHLYCHSYPDTLPVGISLHQKQEDHQQNDQPFFLHALRFQTIACRTGEQHTQIFVWPEKNKNPHH